MHEHILLVEPAYKSKYPPLGLMKIAQYYKERGDHVEFVKALSATKRDKFVWDRVYVSSLFTYNWGPTLKALEYYRKNVKEPASENLVVGGVLATLMPEDIRAVVECRVVTGLLDQKGKLGYDDDDKIDGLVPDYGILEEAGYKYPMSNAYVLYATRGCVRRCDFCAVPTLEPTFKHYLPILDKIREINKRYGAKRDLILLDNNVLASKDFNRIVDDIKAAGFAAQAVFDYQGKNGQRVTVHRRVDFNQGIDVRLLTREKMQKLSEIAINPLRLAFDDIAIKDTYQENVRLAVEFGVRRLSNYVLFNHERDTPEDLYERLRISIRLNEELGLQIFSFPMRHVSLASKDRLTDTSRNIGKHWTRKYLRAIRCILIPTRGVVGTQESFFQAAFGVSADEFRKILLMPERYIINRGEYQRNGSVSLWWQQLNELKGTQREEAFGLILHTDLRHANLSLYSRPVASVLGHYVESQSPQLALDLPQSLPLRMSAG